MLLEETFSMSSVAGPALVGVSDRGRSTNFVGYLTAAQASRRPRGISAECASCHLPDLRGSNEAPPLAGSNF